MRLKLHLALMFYTARSFFFGSPHDPKLHFLVLNWFYEDPPCVGAVKTVFFFSDLVLKPRPWRARHEHNDRGEHTEHGKREQERGQELREEESDGQTAGGLDGGVVSA